jgi:hypothetical protein
MSQTRTGHVGDNYGSTVMADEVDAPDSEKYVISLKRFDRIF